MFYCSTIFITVIDGDLVLSSMSEKEVNFEADKSGADNRLLFFDLKFIFITTDFYF